MAKANVAEIKTWLTLFFDKCETEYPNEGKNLTTLPVSANGTVYPDHFILLLAMILLDMG
ncbi:Hypothetical predicted protein, partial [Paramuricea clavata]